MPQSTQHLPIGAATRAALAAGIFALVLAAVGNLPEARALPPAGTDVLRAAGQVTAESRTGIETINLSGMVTIQRGSPFLDGGVEVANTEITSMTLTGQSVVGPISVVESPTLASTGQLRALQPPPIEYPASSYFDVFVSVTVPGSPYGSLQLSNNAALHMAAATNVTAWPPVTLRYDSPSLRNVDNDGDTLVDEDTSDDDGDHAFDEDPIDGLNNDTDAFFNEDPALAQCTPALCDDDGDGAIDEDPSCHPLFPTLPIGACIVSLAINIYVDTDGDGCADVQETGPSQQLGGRRNPQNQWDFYDVNGDRVVTINDILTVASAFGPSTGPNYSPAKDRRPPPTAAEEPDPTKREPWDLGPPDGAISINADILGAARQFGHNCSTLP